mmetsp:Transcript_113878/g.362048  ORF Transcript_113878/g.362048 Transcript_113878/m.362048 type:complete len:92 (-) Transcript_113878:929-1204(-)
MPGVWFMTLLHPFYVHIPEKVAWRLSSRAPLCGTSCNEVRIFAIYKHRVNSTRCIGWLADLGAHLRWRTSLPQIGHVARYARSQREMHLRW